MQKRLSSKLLLWMGVVSLFGGNFVFAQPPELIWSKAIGEEAAEFIYDTKPLANGSGFVFCGATENIQFGDRRVRLGKMNALGYVTVVWEYKLDWDAEARSVCELPNGDFALCGFMSNGDQRRSFVQRVDSLGRLVWRTLSDAGVWEEAIGIEILGNGSLLVAGTLTNSGFLHDIYTKTFGPTGVLLSQHTFAFPSEQFANALALTEDSHAICGKSMVSAGNYDAFVLNTDMNGDTLWTRTYGDVGQDYASDLLVLEDGSIVVCGGFTRTASNLSNALLAKLSPDGSWNWTTVYVEDATHHIFTIAQASDSGFLFGGSTEVFAGAHTQYLVLKSGHSGTNQWMRRFGGADSDEVQQVLPVADSLLVIGNTLSYSNNSDIEVMMLNADQQIVRQLEYGRSFNEYTTSPLCLEDGGFLVPMGRQISTGVPPGFAGSLTRTDSLGKILWRRQYGLPSFEPQKLIQTFDGGFALLGNSRIKVAKIDSLGIQEWLTPFVTPYGGYGNYMEQAVDGSFIVISDELFGAPHPGQFGVSMFSESGQLASYHTIVTGSEPHITAFSKMPNDEFRLVGYIGSSAFCMALSETGDSLWTVTFPDTGLSVLYSIVPMQDSGFLTVLSDWNGHSTVLRLDNIGNTVWSHLHYPAYDEELFLTRLADGRFMDSYSGLECDSVGRIVWGGLDGGLPFSGAGGTLYTINEVDHEGSGVTTLNYYGEGTAEPQLYVETQYLDFGTVPPGGDSTMSITLRNAGTVPIEITGALVDPPFYVETIFPIFAWQDGSTTIDVRYDPTNNGLHRDTLEIFSFASGGLRRIPVAGRQSLPALHSIPNSFQTLNIVTGDTVTQAIRLYVANLPGTITIDSVSVPENCLVDIALPQTISTGDTVFATIGIVPQESGTFFREVFFYHTGQGGALRFWILTNAVDRILDVQPDTLAFDTVAVGDTSRLQLLLTSPNDVAIRIDSMRLPSWLNSEADFPVLVDEDAPISIEIRFAPENANAFVDGVVFYGNGANMPLILIARAVGVPLDAESEDELVPSSFGITSVSPNPFNPTTTLSFSLPQTSHTKLTVFDVLGRVVMERELGMLNAGVHEIVVDGGEWSSGVYFASVSAGEWRGVVKMAMVK